MRKLVETWIEVERSPYGNNLAAAIQRLNETREMKVTHSRVAEWRRGVYTPSPVVLSALLYRTLPWLLKAAGIAVSPAQLRELEKLIWVTAEEQNGVELL